MGDASRNPPPIPRRSRASLFAQYGEAISELEVRRASLEDTYLALVRQAESHKHDANANEQEEVA